jgi:hypothetical protein
VEIDASAIVAFGQRIGAASGTVQQELGVAMTASTNLVRDQARAAAPVFTGELRDSITATATPTLGTIRATAPHARPVEFGRRAGARMPPVSAIESWVTAHGMPAEAAFVVARAIGRRGIPPRPFLLNTFARLRPSILAEFAKVTVRLVARLRAAA